MSDISAHSGDPGAVPCQGEEQNEEEVSVPTGPGSAGGGSSDSGTDDCSGRLHEDHLHEVADALAKLWSASEDLHRSCSGAPHPRAYVELCLVVAHTDPGQLGDKTQGDVIRERLSEEAIAALDGKGGVTEVPADRSVLVIEDDKTRYIDGEETEWDRRVSRHAGPIAEEAHRLCNDHLDGPASDWAAAAEAIAVHGDLDPISALLSQALAKAKAKAGRGPGTRQAEEETRRRPGQDDGQSAADRPAEGRPRANDPTITSLDESTVDDVQIVSERRYNGIYPVIGGWYRPGTRPPDLNTGAPGRAHSAATKARVDLMPDEEIQALLEREPNGEDVRYFSVPDESYEVITGWRPQLKEHEPLAAINQKILLGYRRDEDWPGEKDCTGMPIPLEYVCGCFGMKPSTMWNRRLSAGMLLEIYRRKVDLQFSWSGWDSRQEKARIVTDHGIPSRVISTVKRAMLGPNDSDSWTYLINGTDAGNRHFTGALRKERLEAFENQDPVIEPPQAAKEIQSYLNSLDQQYFGHGSHGNLRPDQLKKGAKAAAGFGKERRRDQAGRKLIHIRTHPQPLYKFCDRFPRQKADPYNQAMNLPSDILRPMYTDRDYELDLSKAHLASYVPVAKREGLKVPTLERYLEATLKGDTGLLHRGDLWHDLASYMDLDGSAGKKRKTVKTAYSLVYGQDENNLWFALWKQWQRLTGNRLGGTDPFKSLSEHPLMDELLSTRDKLEAIITSRGGLEDANGRFIPLSKWDETKKKANRWRGVMAYVNCSFEQEIMYPIFHEAKKEVERDGKTRFKIWLYQADGVTMRVHRDYAHEPQVARLQSAVAEKAGELGVPTELEIDYPPPA